MLQTIKKLGSFSTAVRFGTRTFGLIPYRKQAPTAFCVFLFNNHVLVHSHVKIDDLQAQQAFKQRDPT